MINEIAKVQAQLDIGELMSVGINDEDEDEYETDEDRRIFDNVCDMTMINVCDMTMINEIAKVQAQLDIGELMCLGVNDEDEDDDETDEDIIFDNVFDMDSYDIVLSIDMDKNQKVGNLVLKLDYINTRMLFKFTKLLFNFGDEIDVEYNSNNTIDISTINISNERMLLLTRFILDNFKNNDIP